MDVNYFIKKFRSIPEALWTTGTQYNGWTYQHCAMGFCDNSEKQPLSNLFNGRAEISVPAVNDNLIGQPFKGATPKARILAALEYIKSL